MTSFVARNILVFLLMVVAILLLTFLGINIYTHHGEAYIVPELRNMTEAEVQAALKGTHMNYEIVDSIYDPKRPLGIVIEQVPKQGNTIKSTRPICLVINARSAETTMVPDVIDYSWRQAEALIRAANLEIGDTITKPGENKGMVLAVMMKGKNVVGKKVPVGSKLTLVICNGARLGNEQYVPNCIGLSLEEASTTLGNVGLHVGNAVYDDGTEGTSGYYYVYHQNPAPDAAREGSAVDLFFTKSHAKLDSVTFKPKNEELQPVEAEEDEFF